ncbi:YbaB/EbfC family nucleoid-associated protein [Desulforamulus ferrireducens]|uniref:Nucleoid-associated protein, YbaB/EbfC family n=1 Tax=Desulforamulus ferrireducens TaxID=1833852 RepID=A0A1S6ISU4_9FIRM|nr:YbaB/EbfC family nucleoid-associated protein [Desulforamulus ferrireducens]AQS57840.1 nucleoid-associated protein, YbaB/EbfC family [Desulforamulus ferrireducens]
MLGNVTKIFGQLQGLQQTLKELTVEGSAGDGLVKVLINGQQNVLAVRFDPERIRSVEPAELGSLVVEAYNQAQMESKIKAREEVTKTTGLNLSNLPGIF